MPEIKHNFTGGKMNKDLDERLVPKGEYRDAMNVQVSTSEGSDVGAVQNILGNIAGCSASFNDYLGKDAYTVGSVSDEKNDSFYWLVSGNAFSNIDSLISGSIASSDTTDNFGDNLSMKDFICKYSTDGCQLVFVDKYAFYVPNEEGLNTNSNTLSLSNLPGDYFNEIEIGWNIVGVNSNGQTSNAVKLSDMSSEVVVDFTFASALSTTISQNYTFVSNNINPMVQVGTNVYVPVYPGVGCLVGYTGSTPCEYSPTNSNIIYISNWTGGSLSQLIGDEVFIDGIAPNPGLMPSDGLISMSASSEGYAGPKIISASWVEFTYDPPGIKEDVVELQLSSPLNWANLPATLTLAQPNSLQIYGKVDGVDNIVTSSFTTTNSINLKILSKDATTTNLATGWLYLDPDQQDVSDLSVGNQVQYNGFPFVISDIDDTSCGASNFVGPSGLCNAIQLEDNNENLFSGFQVGGFLYGTPQPDGGVLQILTDVTLILNDNLNLTGGYDGLMFYGPRTLNFNHGEDITGVDIIDDMLFWTDGRTEPKKINIPRSIEGTIQTGEHSTRLINPPKGLTYPDNIIAREEHITVIRKSPKNTLTLELSDGRDKNRNYTAITTIGVDENSTNIVSSSNTTVQYDFSGLQVGDNVTFTIDSDINGNQDVGFAWQVGGYLLLQEYNQDGVAPNTPLANWTIRGLIVESTGNVFDFSTGTVQVEIQVVGINGVPSSPVAGDDFLQYVVDYEDTEPVIYEDKFPRFSYRYKYEDGEYSTFAPWSEVAFLPTSFNYDPKKGWNTGMLNNIKSITVKGFVPTVTNLSIGRDVVAVDILYKEDVSPNVYLVQTISPIDIIPFGNTQRAWDSNEYTIKSETIKGTIPPNQLLRTWDNVPKTALAQAVSGSRIIYGNYEQNYDLKVSGLNYQPDFKNSLYSWSSVESGAPKKSIKSLRDYKLGVVFTDKYGRETPVLIGESGGFKVEKTESIKANKLKVGLNGIVPPQMAYYKFYIKETSSEYYNVPMDRWYKAEDGNIWLAFPSSDRNKIDLDTFLYFKRGVDGDKNVIENSTKYKVLAIENEAPEFIKTRRVRIGTVTHFNTGGTNMLFDINNNPPVVNEISFTMSYDAGFASTSLSRMEDITEDIYVQFVSENNVSQQYKVSEITSNRDETSSAASNEPSEYYVTLATNIKDDINFIFDSPNSINQILDETKIAFTKALVENKPQFDGRFFVKIENDGKIQTQITDETIGVNYVETSSKKVYLLPHDTKLRTLSVAAVHGPDVNWIAQNTFNNGNPRTEYGRNFSNCLARESYFHKEGSVDYLRGLSESAADNILDGKPYSYLVNGYAQVQPGFPQKNMGVWFIDEGTIKYTIPTSGNDDNDLVWPNSSNMNDEFSPECNNAAECGYAGPSGNTGDGIKNPSSDDKSIINLGFGGFRAIKRSEWSGGGGFYTMNDFYGTFSDFFSFGSGTRVNNSETTSFVNSLSGGFKFKWKEDPTETIYTITSQIGYRRNARFGRYDHDYWTNEDADLLDYIQAGVGASGDLVRNPQVMLIGAASSYTKTFDFEVTPSMSGWNPAEGAGTSIVGGLHLGAGGSSPSFDEDLYTTKLTVDAASGSSVIQLDDVSDVRVGMSIGFHANIPNLAKVEAIDTTGFTAPKGEVNLSLATTTGTINANTDIQFGWVIRLVENNMYTSGDNPSTSYNHIVVDNITTRCSNGNDLKPTYSLHKGMKLHRYNIGGASKTAHDVVIKDIKEHVEGWEIELAGYIQPLNYSATHPFTLGAPTVGERLQFIQVCMNGASNFTEINTDACQYNAPEGGSGGASNELGKIAAVGYEMVFVEPIDEYADGGNLPENPFVWETEPKEDTGLDIYYEISDNNPTKLNASNINEIIPVGSRITSESGEGLSDWSNITVSSNSFSSGREIRPSGSFAIAGQGGSQVLPLDVGSILKITRPNGIAFELVVEALIPNTINPAKPGNIRFREDIQNSNYFLNWHNCYSFGNGVESNRIKDTFNLPFIANGVKASTTLTEDYKQERRKNGLIYSGIYNSMSGINNLNQFIAAEKITKDINPIYGSIQKLYSRATADGDLITLCEDRVLKILANKDAVFNADGNTQLTATNNVLGQAIPYSGEYGISKNPESFASESYRCYFTDKIRGAVVRLSKDGLTPISNFGMKDWFRDNLKLSNKLVGSYDDKKNEYNITLDNSEDNTPKTVSFKENVKGWVSFKSFTPENAISCANEYYTFKQGIPWKHHVEQFNGQGEEINRNVFYNINSDSALSSITAVLNDEPGVVKSFKTLNYEGSQSKIDELKSYQIYLPGTINPDTGIGVINTNATSLLSDNEYYNLTGKDGWYVETIQTDLERGSVNEFIKKEGKWFNNIKGVADISNAHGTFLSNFDSSDSSFQGLGRLISEPFSADLTGCTDASAFNYDENAQIDDDSCIDVVLGCMDEDAINYSSIANTDDDTCIITGCTDITAFNYDPLANTDDGSCIEVVVGCNIAGQLNYDDTVNTPDNSSCIPVVNGCTDSTAFNYDALANTDDGSCIAIVYGCMDPASCNYDNLANIDDGLCAYCNDPDAANFDGYDDDNNTIAQCDTHCMYCLPPTSVSTSTTDDSITINITEPTGSAHIYQYSVIIQGGGINFGFSVQAVAPGGTVSRTINASMLPNNDPIIASTEYTIEITTTCSNNSTNWFGDSDTITTVVTTLAAPQPGCTNSGYVEYYTQGFSASVDDGSCQTVVSLGCMDIDALNYVSTANVDDGSCIQPTFGCTNSTATNYNSAATSDNGSCIIEGCTDHGSIYSDGDGGFLVPTNSNPDATVEDTDNPCTYEGCTDVDADNYLGSHVTIHQPGSCSYYGCTDTDATNYSFQNDDACIDSPDITTCINGGGSGGSFGYLQGYAVDDDSCEYPACQQLSLEALDSTDLWASFNLYTGGVQMEITTGGTSYASTASGGYANDFEVDLQISTDPGSGILIYDQTNITGILSVSANPLTNTPAYVFHRGVVASTFGSTTSLIDTSDYIDQLTFKYIVRSNDGVCTRTIEKTFSAGCTDPLASNTGQYDISDMRKCSYI